LPGRTPAQWDPAGVQVAAPVEGTDDQASRQPSALSDWIGSGPPLPSALVYLALFASVFAIVVSTRRELGLGPRRRRRL
jgi:hypothetical protein